MLCHCTSHHKVHLTPVNRTIFSRIKLRALKKKAPSQLCTSGNNDCLRVEFTWKRSSFPPRMLHGNTVFPRGQFSRRVPFAENNFTPEYIAAPWCSIRAATRYAASFITYPAGWEEGVKKLNTASSIRYLCDTLVVIAACS